jgi:hypothetical protein
MRLDFMQRQKRWEAQLAREAPPLASDPIVEEDEDDTDLPTSSSAMQISSQQPEDEVDEVLQREDQELEALLEYMPDNEKKQDDTPSSGNLWSDDDDYDALFSEVMEQEQEMGWASGKTTQAQQTAHMRQQDDEMDLS